MAKNAAEANSDAEAEVDQAKITIRSSDMREEVMRELGQESDQRPSDLEETICARTGLSQANLYSSLSTLVEDGLVEKTEGKGRAVLYSLTNFGETVADELGLIETTDQSDSADEELPIDLDAAPDNPVEREQEGFAQKMPVPEQDAESSPSSDDLLTIQLEPPTQGDLNEAYVDHLTDQLEQYLKTTNVSIYELIAAVERLQQSETES